MDIAIRQVKLLSIEQAIKASDGTADLTVLDGYNNEVRQIERELKDLAKRQIPRIKRQWTKLLKNVLRCKCNMQEQLLEMLRSRYCSEKAAKGYTFKRYGQVGIFRTLRFFCDRLNMSRGR